MIHNFNGESLIYDVVYKNRKSIAIYVDGYAHVEVRAPKGATAEEIKRVLEIKWEVIKQTRHEMQDRLTGSKVKQLQSGEDFLYLGRSYPIQLVVDPELKQDFARLEDDHLQVYLREDAPERVRQALRRLYYQQCRALVTELIRRYQGEFKDKPRSISIADDPRVWGTCNGKRELTFNWKLAMAPAQVVEYIVVHELCHLQHLNHDRSFWRLVGRLLPDYREREAWLAKSAWKMEF